MPRCKFCGNELKEGLWDHYDSYYYCSCEGQKKYNELCREASFLKTQLLEKEQEIEAFELSGEYGKAIKQQKEIETNLKRFKDAIYWQRG